jgi:hypothetical protein
MSFISETLRNCEVMLARAARNGFAVNVKGSCRGATRIDHRANPDIMTHAKAHERRRKIALMLATTGMTQTEIAIECGCGKSLVSHIACQPWRTHDAVSNNHRAALA